MKMETGMPPVQPAEMPEQDFSRKPTPVRKLKRTFGQHLRRWGLLLSAIALLGYGGFEMYGVLALGGMVALEWAMLVLFIATFGWIALAAVSAVAGFCRQWSFLSHPPIIPEGFSPQGRTAILMPCYNEDPAMIASELEGMIRELEKMGNNHWFDWVLLSDTRDPHQAIKEEETLKLMRKRLGDKTNIYYRRRRFNTDRKAGNVAEFCRNWGSHFDYLLVLDADSVISAEVLSQLVYRMESDPEAGLIQTVPKLVGGTSLIARIQQFANAVYGPVVGSGLAFWTNPEGNFWGHNAIIRRQAFMDAAGLPRLSGKAPFGGTIMSHDFVEAALLRRAGWKVVIADDLNGSYEESPPSIIDLAVRDRRWCQGNLQHSKVIGAKGLNWVNRMHLLTGIMSYVSSPLWLALITVGIMLALQAQYIRPEYFSSDFSLFPTWPRQDARRAVRLFILTMLVLFVPKILGTLLFMLRSKLRQGTGGGFRTIVSVLWESIMSAAVAPIMMCIHCGAVFSTLLGGDSGWNPQRRQDGTLPWKELFYRHRWHTFSGIALALIAWSNSWFLLAWLSPAIFGLLLSAPLSAFTSSPKVGNFFKRLGILRTPEETRCPSVLTAVEEAEAVYAKALDKIPTLDKLLEDPAFARQHLALTPEADEDRFSPEEAIARVKMIDAKDHRQALEWFTDKELTVVLASPYLFKRLLKLAIKDQEPSSSKEAATLSR